MAAAVQGWRRSPARAALIVLALAVLGGAVGLFVGILTPAHVEVAGSDTRVWLKVGRDYDQLGIRNILTGTRATTRNLFGEPVGVRAVIDLDASELTDASGQFNVDVLPAYIQAYSDPAQLVHDAEHALLVHLVLFGVLGMVVFVGLYAAWRGYRAWRRAYDRRQWPDADVARLVRAYRAPERNAVRNVLTAIVLLVVIFTVPSGRRVTRPEATVVGDRIFDGTALAGVQVSGLLRPAFVAAESYVQTYFERTNTYYDHLRDRLHAYLDDFPVVLPGTAPDGTTPDDVVHFGFVTDRHCNIGMDRVIVALLQHFDVHTLVSGGDDAFSGSFGFESACTRNLADKTHQVDITDLFVGGNHDSSMTLADEAEQGITVLDGTNVVEHEGLQFVGSPDPRTSRYGQGLEPSARGAQDRLLRQQGRAAGRIACTATGAVIVVLHGPLAGQTAMQTGCGHIVLALDGHTHVQEGPTAIRLPGAGVGYQFVGASSGGAPNESAIEHSLASQLTVGPLNHDATVDIVTVRRSDAALLGVTEFRFTPDQHILVTQQATR